MQPGQPSRTALGAAAHRAAHQVLENAAIFSDPLALRILGDQAEAVVEEARENASRRRMRMFIAARTHFTETALATAVAEGVTQLVVLGAGLDTFAYRNPYPGLRVFEVDHPATQAWKRERLAATGIAIPASLTFAPIDFEQETLAAGLAAAGFEAAQSTFFTWLGVVPYLTEPAIWSTLGFVASLPARAHVVFDYADPPATLDASTREHHDTLAARVQSIGEAWLTFFEGPALRAKLSDAGFTRIEDFGPPELSARYFPNRTTPVPQRGGHLLYASTH